MCHTITLFDPFNKVYKNTIMWHINIKFSDNRV